MEQNNALKPNATEDEKKEYLRSITTSRNDVANFIENDVTKAGAMGHDPFRQSKITTFNAGPDGMQFDRYYNHPAYNRLGFNPNIDMEEYYNDNTSKWEDFGRTQTQWSNLFGLAWDSLLGNKSDVQEAFDYEKYSRIGSTSREGVFGTLNNTYLNSGYTVGLLSEIAVEEIGLGLATVLTEGGAGSAAASRTAFNIGRLSKIGMNTGKFAKNITRTFDRLKDLKDASKARTAWNKMYNLGKAANPLKGGTQFTKALFKGEMSKLDNLAILNKGFGSFYRDIREINLALSESGLEAGFVHNSVTKELFDEYAKENGGKPPTGEDLKRIQKHAEDAANSAYLMNAGLIYATNRLAFDGFFRKYSPKFGAENLMKNNLGKVVKNKGFMKSGQDAFEFVKKGIKSEFKHAFKKSTLKQAPLNTLKFLGKYTKVNFAEGAQEFGQEIIQDAELNRAKDDYYSGIKGGWYNHYAASTDKFTSKEGVDVFMSGFLMGGMVGPYVKAQEFVMDKGSKLGSKIFTPGKYAENENYKSEREEEIRKNVDKLNEMTKNPTKNFNMSSLNAVVDQAEVNMKAEEAAKNGDEKTFRDIEDVGTAKAILFALNSGGYDALVEQLEDMSKMSEEELQEAFKGNLPETEAESFGSFKKNADDIIKRAKDIKRFKDEVDKRFVNPYSSTVNDSDVDGEIDENLKYQAYESAKANIVLNQYSFMRTLERMDSTLDDFLAKKPFWKGSKVPATDLSILFNRADMDREVTLLESELDSLTGEGATKEQTKTAEGKQKRLEALRNFRAVLGQYDFTAAHKDKFEKAFGDKVVQEPIIGAEVTLNTKKGGKARIVSEATTKGGKPAWKLDNGRTVLKTSVKLDGQIEMDFDAQVTEPLTEQLRKEFDAYMKVIAEDNQDFVKTEDMDGAFQKLLDFFALDQDSKNLSELVNRLVNPKGFDAYANRQNAVYQKQWEDRVPQMEEDLRNFYKKAEQNEFLNLIAKKYNAFILEEDLEKLFDDAVIPTDFYDIAKLKPLNKESERYAGVLEEIEKFLKGTGEVAEPEVDEDGRRKPRDIKTRPGFEKTPNTERFREGGTKKMFRLDEDNRYTEDLEKDYDMRQGSVKGMKLHIQDVIDNPMTHPYLKSIFEKLLPNIPEGATIKWDENIFYEGAGGYYSMGTKQVTMDQMGHEYGSSYEAVLLHEVVHLLTSDEMSLTGWFGDKVDALYQETLKYLEDKGIDTNYYGFTNIHEFLAEAFSDPAFQVELLNVPPGKDKSIWQKFMDLLSEFLNVKFGIDIKPSALTDVFFLVDSYLNGSVYNQSVNKLIEASKKEGGKPLTEAELLELYTKPEIIKIAENEGLIDMGELQTERPKDLPPPTKKPPVKKVKEKITIDQLANLADADALPTELEADIQNAFAQFTQARLDKGLDMLDMSEWMLSEAGRGYIAGLLKEYNGEDVTPPTPSKKGGISIGGMEESGFEQDAPEDLEGIDQGVERPTVTIKFGKDNTEKLLAGQKTTTIRDSGYANKVKLGKLLDAAYFMVTDAEGKQHRFTILNRGFLTVDEAGGAEAMVISEGLPTIPTEENKFPVTVNDVTYYTMFKGSADWIGGKGKRVVFDIAEAPEIEEVTVDEITVVNQYEKEFRKKLNDATTIDEIQAIEAEMADAQVAAVMRHGIILDDVLTELVAERLEAINKSVQIDNISVGEKLVLRGKLANFGLSQVTQKGQTKKGYKFIKVRSLEHPELAEEMIYENQTKTMIAQKGTTPLTETTVSTKEKELINDSPAPEALSKEELDKLQEEAKSLSPAERRAKLKENRQKRC